MNEDLLTRLAQVDLPTRTPPLGRIERRALSIKRARHGRRVGLVAVGAGAFVLGGMLLPPGTTPGPVARGRSVSSYLELQSARAADVGGPDCNTGFGSWVEPDEWGNDPAIAQSASLLAKPPFPLTALGVHQQAMGCPTVFPAAVLYSTSPIRGVSLWADVVDPFAGNTEPISDLRVRNTSGQLRVVSDSLFVSWLEPDGRRWFAMGSGQDADQMVAVLDGLRFRGTTLDPATVPDGFTAAPIGPAPTSTVTRRWTVQYGDDPETGLEEAAGAEPHDEVTLEVTTSPVAPLEVAASGNASAVQFVQVNGQLAVYSPWGDPTIDTGGWLKWQESGVTYTLANDHGLENSLQLAAQVEHITLDDPRVVPTKH